MHVIDHFESYQTGGTYLQVRIRLTSKMAKLTCSVVLGPLLKQGVTQSADELVATVVVAEDVVQVAVAEMVVGIETDVPKLTPEPEASDYSIVAAAAVAGGSKIALDGMLEVVQMGRFESLAAKFEHNSDEVVEDHCKLAAAGTDDQGAVVKIHSYIAGCIQAGE